MFSQTSKYAERMSVITESDTAPFCTNEVITSTFQASFAVLSAGTLKTWYHISCITPYRRDSTAI